LSSRLQALLQAVSPGRQDVRVDVINCGANDYGEREARLFYEHMAAQYQPDLVLLLVAPPAHESPVDVVRVHTPRHLNLDPAAEAAARLARRGANRVLDAVASAAEIGRLSGAARARGGRLAVLLAQDRSDAGWTGFADSLAAMLRRTEIPLHPMKSLLPGTGNREGFLVYPGMDGHPNELAHDLAARETLAFLRQHGLLSGW